jgi:hypothetical protein
MGKVVIGLIAVVGFWVGTELFMYGPSHAFDGALAGLFSNSGTTPTSDHRTTAQRAGDSVRQSQAEAESRRDRMLAE